MKHIFIPAVRFMRVVRFAESNLDVPFILARRCMFAILRENTYEDLEIYELAIKIANLQQVQYPGDEKAKRFIATQTYDNKFVAATNAWIILAKFMQHYDIEQMILLG